MSTTTTFKVSFIANKNSRAKKDDDTKVVDRSAALAARIETVGGAIRQAIAPTFNENSNSIASLAPLAQAVDGLAKCLVLSNRLQNLGITATTATAKLAELTSMESTLHRVKRELSAPELSAPELSAPEADTDAE